MFLSDSERAKKRKNMFLSDSEGLKSEILLSERLRTIKKRKVMLLSDSERSKRRITKKKVDY